ncbi:MAG: metallophosphoesterase, partial [Oscillospiraceae bacterium]|nr:metallophosphoesterase [Oscillospiraceae bacterium]
MLYSGKVMNAKTGTPICGVPVSDGRNTVLTDAQGCYSLPGWESSHTVWVGMLTCGHSDWYHFTDGKAGTYDFSLTPWESDKLDLLHISDTEISADKDVEWVDFLADYAKKLKPAMVMHTGDITRRDGILLHTATMNYEKMGCPVRYVMGNHDYAVATDPTAHYGEQPYEEEAGPVWNSFDCAGIHCVVLAIGKGSRGDMPSGYTREDQWEWLKQDLEIAGKGKPLVVFEHGPGPDPYHFVMDGLDLK